MGENEQVPKGQHEPCRTSVNWSGTCDKNRGNPINEILHRYNRAFLDGVTILQNSANSLDFKAKYRKLQFISNTKVPIIQTTINLWKLMNVNFMLNIQ